ncbi:hypothetical protein CY34DRAFT_744386 [Suillus luteus UH-Slu-Lm8-n1]|uniref:Uncharacterized protein n=1 Tax=Suillus luteus UH-Slu-Lm8-n1 TaxID=930992 RepID=A0A0D0BIF5_9AGAM|nr:hypothetical protein CY34DRAFT_744386 [Suillus luteus UH-Slu-Lm8-n1]
MRCHSIITAAPLVRGSSLLSGTRILTTSALGTSWSRASPLIFFRSTVNALEFGLTLTEPGKINNW